MTAYLGPSLLLALLWVMITAELSLASYLVGFGISFGLLVFLRPKNIKITWKKIPGQGIALLRYLLEMYRDIFLSSVDIARRVLSRDMRLKPGVVAIPTHDKYKSPTIAALSGNSISLTPGELIIDVEDNQVLYIHSLDIDATLANTSNQQKKRVKQLAQILGKEAA